MISTNQLLTIDKSLPIPVYQQIANGIIMLIQQGLLKPGTALLPTRTLSKNLEVHRKTVIAAYDDLYAQSYTESIPNKGMFVANNLPEVALQQIADMPTSAGVKPKAHFVVGNKVSGRLLFKAPTEGNLVINTGFPDVRMAPLNLLMREYRRLSSYHFTDKYLMYGSEKGSENLRIEVAKLLSETRGLAIGAEDLLITKGVQMALYICSQILLSKNDVVIVGEPGYTGANEIFVQAGAKLELVPVDDCGINIDVVENMCQKKKVKLLYVIPHHHTPTTVTLSPERRMRLIELAQRYKFAIIEDDYDFDFHYSSSPILPLASVDHYGSVIYVGSFCKTIAPGIRIGFMTAPKNLMEQAVRLRRLIDRQGEQLLEEAVAGLIKNGDIGRHLKKANKIYNERRDLLCRLLKENLTEHITFKIPNGGFAVWVTFKEGLDAVKIAAYANEMGLTMSDGTENYQDSNHKNDAVRLGFASLNSTEIEEAVVIITRAVKKVLAENV